MFDRLLDAIVESRIVVQHLAHCEGGRAPMLYSWFSQIRSITLLVAICTPNAGAWPHEHGQKARVRFLAASTLIRGTWGKNEDTYLAQIELPKENKAFLVRLVDAYPNESPPLSYKVLTSTAGTLLLVKRDAECDRPFGEMLLRAAPGDLLAILPERLSYWPPIDHTPAPGTILLCYRVIRQ